MFFNFRTRARARALTGVALAGLGLGVAIAAVSLDGYAAHAAVVDAHPDRLADAAKAGYAAAAAQSLSPAPPPAAKPPSDEPGPASLPAPVRAAPSAKASGDLDCLSAAVYYEARGESAAGQAAVAQVVLNRAGHGSYPASVCGVVYQGVAARGCQFSFACDGAMRRPREPTAWAAAQRVAERALHGYVMAGVGKATNFHGVQLGAVWGRGMIQVAQIGRHIFYSPTGRSDASRRPMVTDNAAEAVRSAAAAAGVDHYTFALGVLTRIPTPQGGRDNNAGTVAAAGATQVRAEPAPPAMPTQAS